MAFARECVASEGKQFKKSEVLAFMRDFVSVLETTIETPEHASMPDVELGRYEALMVQPERTATGGVYLPPNANRYYTPAQARTLAARLIAIAV